MTLLILAKHSVWIPGVGESSSLPLSFFHFFPSISGLFKQVNDLSDRDNPLTLGTSFMSGLFVFSEHNVSPP